MKSKDSEQKPITAIGKKAVKAIQIRHRFSLGIFWTSSSSIYCKMSEFHPKNQAIAAGE